MARSFFILLYSAKCKMWFTLTTLDQCRPTCELGSSVSRGQWSGGNDDGQSPSWQLCQAVDLASIARCSDSFWGFYLLLSLLLYQCITFFTTLFVLLLPLSSFIWFLLLLCSIKWALSIRIWLDFKDLSAYFRQFFCYSSKAVNEWVESVDGVVHKATV